MTDGQAFAAPAADTARPAPRTPRPRRRPRRICASNPPQPRLASPDADLAVHVGPTAQ